MGIFMEWIRHDDGAHAPTRAAGEPQYVRRGVEAGLAQQGPRGGVLLDLDL